MLKRYSRTIGALTEDDQNALFTKKVLIVGVGGLGGYNAEYFARLGVKEIRICDYDVFDETNLNRQLNCYENNIGEVKTSAVCSRIKQINGAIEVICFDKKFDEYTADQMLSGVDVVLDALDNVETRLVLEREAARLNIPLVFAALSCWEGQISTVLPYSGTLSKIYKNSDICSLPVPVMPFTPAAISAFQCAEAVKVLLGRAELAGKLLLVELENNNTEILNI